MKKKLTNNLGMRILAVVIAILIWIIVVNVSDPIIESTYSGIPVEIINADTITKQNKTYDILNDTDSISVTLSAKRSISDLLGRDNIKATADLANLDMEKGTVRIKLETNKYNDKIESIKAKNDILEVSIENLMRKQFAVVTVQGPESIVSQIDKAVVEASVAGMSTSISTTSTIRYYDADGNQLDSARLSGNISSVNLKVDVLATKMLGFRFNTTGELDPDYAIAGDITSDIDEVLVAGKSSIVTNTSAIAIPASAIDIEGKRETFSLTIDVTKYLPDTLKLIDEDFDGKITVTVPIEKMQSKEVEVAKSNITISGYDEDTQTVALVGTGINVGIKGLAADIQDMKKNAIKGEIDVASYMEDNNLTELKPGVYNFPVQLTLPDGIQTVRETYTAECRVKNID